MEQTTSDETVATRAGWLERGGLAIAAWSERWFPEAWIFALLGIVVVFIFGLALGESPARLATEGGKSFWALVPFTMQMMLIIVGGHVLATSPPVYRLIRRAADVTRNPRSAVAWIALFSMATSLVSWGLSLIFSGLLVREMSQRVKRLDYRAAGAAAYLGLGAVWALGLSSSAAMMMATREAIPAKLFETSGLIPLTQTLFIWPNLAMALILIAVSVAIAYFSTPGAERSRTAADFGLRFEPLDEGLPARAKPGEWLEYSPLLILLVVGLLGWHLVRVFRNSSTGPLAALDLNNYNLLFITLGMLLHWRPKRFLKAVAQAVPATGGVLIQFPFYAVIFGMIVGTRINTWLADLFVSITTRHSYPLLVAAYSAVMGVFIPSGGSKWVVEAPYILDAAVRHEVNLGWVVQTYNAAEALPNLLNPFWMLPLLGILRVKARDLVGFSVLQLIIHVPLVFLLCWAFSYLIPFVPVAQ